MQRAPSGCPVVRGEYRTQRDEPLPITACRQGVLIRRGVDRQQQGRMGGLPCRVTPTRVSIRRGVGGKYGVGHRYLGHGTIR